MHLKQVLIHLFFNLGDSSHSFIFKKQITKLEIKMTDYLKAEESSREYTEQVYVHILSFCENLQHLHVITMSEAYKPILSLRFLPSNMFSSSTLTYLCIDVADWADCLCLLDGRLKQLNTLIIQVNSIPMEFSTRMHSVSLSCFR